MCLLLLLLLLLLLPGSIKIVYDPQPTPKAIATLLGTKIKQVGGLVIGLSSVVCLRQSACWEGGRASVCGFIHCSIRAMC
jgi:hypothetical protein